MFNSLLPLVVVLVLLLVIVAVIKIILRQKAQGAQNYPYEKEQALFSPAERSFLGVLEQADNGRYRFMGKVRLADIVRVKSGMNKSARQNAFNKIQSKHVDIVACDPASLSVQFVIELDDSTHSQSKRQNRDQFVDNTLRAAGIPVVHVTAKKTYSVQDIQGILSQAEVASKL
jgi:very-short-patch-repair endonuclease